ncbi:MAG: glycosyltransferase family 39 protein [Candidatus Binatia bacterium]
MPKGASRRGPSAATSKRPSGAAVDPAAPATDGRRIEAPTLRVAILAGLTALGLGLRLYRLGHDPLWFDEAYTALTAQKSVGEILRLLRTEVSAPLYYLMLHWWEPVAGDSDFALRLLSALTAAAVVPMIYLVAAGLFSPTAGLIAAALATVGPLHVHYSQELRMYGMVPLAALGVLHGFAKLVRAPDWRGVAILAVALTAGLYLHYFVLFLLPLAASVALSPRPARSAMLTALALGIAGLAFLPWIGTLLGQAGPNHATDWIAAWWKAKSLWIAIPWSLMVLGPGAEYPPGWFKLGSMGLAGDVSFALAVALLGSAAFFAVTARRDARISWLLALGAVIVPLAVALAVSVLRSPIYVVGRYDIIAWAPYVILAGAVLARLPVLIALPALALWIVLSCVTLVPHLTTDRPIRVAADRGAMLADMIGRRAVAGDVVIFSASTRPVTEHYLGAYAARLRLISYPLGTDDHLGWIDLRIATDETFASNEAQRMSTWLTTLTPPPTRLWIVEPTSMGNRPLLEALKQLGYTPDQTRSAPHLLGLVASPLGGGNMRGQDTR